MARFFLPRKQIHGSVGNLNGPELEHLRKVLRLKPGDRITVFDDAGWEHEAVIRSLSNAQGDVEILRSYPVARESPLHLTLAVGLTKGKKIDLVVEKATELGAQRIIPIASTHAVPKLDEKKIAGRTERWRKIALSATKQCGRIAVPEISPLVTFTDLILRAAPQSAKLLCWEKETEQSLRQAHEKLRDAKELLIVVGPEGGVSSAEAELALRRT